MCKLTEIFLTVDSEEHDGGKYSLPNAIQLQSVLPILMSNHPRQPTPMEVQNTLASFPNAAELMARYRLLNSSAAKKHSNSNNSNQKYVISCHKYNFN